MSTFGSQELSSESPFNIHDDNVIEGGLYVIGEEKSNLSSQLTIS